jgi:hypothetical protein
MKDKLGIEAVQLSKYEERNYIETPDNKGWIKYGDDNLFPQYLIGLFNGSAVHRGVTESIGRMIYGDGIQGNVEAKLQIQEWGAEDDFRKCAIDLKLQGGFALEIHWNIDRSKIKSVQYVPFEYIRSGTMNEDGTVDFYYHCLDWENHNKAGVTPICCFSSDKKKDYPHQLLYVKPFTVGSMYYPKPDYMGAINWIEVDKEVAVFHNTNLRNGMSPSFAIHWKNGIPDPLKRAEIRRDVESSMSGTRNAGKFWMTFSDGGDTTPEIVPFELSQAAEQYQFISEEATEKIMIGHRVTSPALFGVKTAGQLGSTEELKVASEIFQKNVIEPYQRILNEAINTLLEASGVSRNAEVVSAPLEFKDDKGKMSDEDGEKWLAYLQNVGEKIDLEEWDLAGEYEVDDPALEYQLHDAETVNFFSRLADPDAKSEIDTGLYKIRYRYSQNLSDNSRQFCTVMVGESKAGTVYRYEDIVDMQAAQVNAEFAPKGQSSYSIWLHKGGAYCHHRWIRQVYFRKRSGGKFLPNDGLNNDKQVSEATARRAGVPFLDMMKGWNTAKTRPIDTPNRGKLN